MRAPLNIAICGCGPAGLAAALLLQRTGHKVRIFERFATPRPIGSGLFLQPSGLGVLAELNLVDAVAALGARVDRILGLAVPSGRAVLDVRYGALGAGWHSIAVHRGALFATLHDAAIAAQIPIVANCEITGFDRSAAGANLRFADSSCSEPFDLVVDAMGARSALLNPQGRRTLPYGALWVNVPWPDSGFSSSQLEQRYWRASLAAGVLPIGRVRQSDPTAMAAFFWILKGTDFEAWRSLGVGAWKDQVAKLWPQVRALLDPVTDCEQLVFARYEHFTMRQPCSERLVHIGDAAHCTSPQLGQGANMALLDALALARALGPNEHTLAQAVNDYARMRRWHVRVFQWASYLFTPFYQSDSRALAWTRDWIAAPLASLPLGQRVLARLVSGMTTAPLAGEKFSAWQGADRADRP